MNRSKSWLQNLLNLVFIFAITFAIAGVITRYVFASVHVVGDSMYPTLHDGDYGYVDIASIRFKEVERFDIVVIEIPQYNELLVKRVVGLPGEIVTSFAGNLYVNGTLIEQPFISQEERLGTMFSEISLAENDYYVLGDNRTNSTDSRVFGAIQKDQIVARGFLKLGACQNSQCSSIAWQWPSLIR